MIDGQNGNSPLVPPQCGDHVAILKEVHVFKFHFFGFSTVQLLGPSLMRLMRMVEHMKVSFSVSVQGLDIILQKKTKYESKGGGPF